MKRLIHCFNRPFFGGCVLGLILGLLLSFGLPITTGHAKKPSRIDILFNVATQNYYLIQKVIAYQKYNVDLALKIAERNKVKADQIIPLTNAVQQEIFKIDLKLNELNK